MGWRGVKGLRVGLLGIFDGLVKIGRGERTDAGSRYLLGREEDRRGRRGFCSTS